MPLDCRSGVRPRVNLSQRGIRLGDDVVQLGLEGAACLEGDWRSVVGKLDGERDPDQARQDIGHRNGAERISGYNVEWPLLSANDEDVRSSKYQNEPLACRQDDGVSEPPSDTGESEADHHEDVAPAGNGRLRPDDGARAFPLRQRRGNHLGEPYLAL